MAARTKSALKKVLKKKYITVNGEVATTATFIRGGETIVINVPTDTLFHKKFTLSLHVLFEDDYLAVVHKPAGILVSGNSFKTMDNALAQNVKPSTQVDAAQPRPVHRLDYATTGILLVGKTHGCIRALNAVFADKQVRKTYYAVTIGKMDKEGVISKEIDKKQATSYFTLLQSVASPRFGTLNLVLLTPLTGRRHQLRKHLASIGNPILGDKTYGTNGLILNGKGLYLHAGSLGFKHPFTKEEMYLTDNLPDRFKKLFGAKPLGAHGAI